MTDLQELHAAMDQLSEQFILRVHESIPEEGMQAFQQWREAFDFARRHPQDTRIREHADLGARMLQSCMAGRTPWARFGSSV